MQMLGGTIVLTGHPHLFMDIPNDFPAAHLPERCSLSCVRSDSNVGPHVHEPSASFAVMALSREGYPSQVTHEPTTLGREVIKGRE